MNTPVIETERLLLRPISQKDKYDLHAFLQDEDVSRYTGWGSGISEQAVESWLVVQERNMMLSSSYRWVITMKPDGDFIGLCSISYSIFTKMYEVSYYLAKNHWGAGYATEAMSACMDFAINRLHIEKFSAKHAASNPASGRVLEKLGFSYACECTLTKLDGSQQFEAKEYRLHVPAPPSGGYKW